MRLHDAKEVAEILQVNVQRVYELTRREILPSVRIGPKQIRFEETRLMQWIEHGGKLNAEGVEAKLAAQEGLSASGADSSRGRNRSGNRLDESTQGSPLRFDELREFEPIRFVLECAPSPRLGLSTRAAVRSKPNINSLSQSVAMSAGRWVLFAMSQSVRERDKEPN